MSVGTKAAQKLEAQKQLLATAALMEAGRIANNKLTALAADKLPAPLSMFAATPVGALILANLIQMAGEQFRPGDELVTRLTNAMIVAAYTSAIQSFNIEGIINELTGDKGIMAALSSSVPTDKPAE